MGAFPAWGYRGCYAVAAMIVSHVEAVPSEAFAWVVSRVEGTPLVVRTAVYRGVGALRKPWMVQGRWFALPEEAAEAAVMRNVALLAADGHQQPAHEGAKPSPFTESAVNARALTIPDEMVVLGYSLVRGRLHRTD